MVDAMITAFELAAEKRRPRISPSVSVRVNKIAYPLYAFIYAIQLALEAILGHKSAHSFDTGPVIADPEKKNTFFY